MNGLVGHFDMQRIGIGVRIDRDGGDTQAARGLDDPAGDLAAIGDEDLVEHARPLFDHEQRLAIFDGLSVLDHDGGHDA